jgi:hypothetical protein
MGKTHKKDRGLAGIGVSITIQYLYSFWWSLSILLGSELISDVQPRTDGEVVFTIFAQIIGAVLFGMIIGTVGTLLMSSKLLEEKVDRQLAELRCGLLYLSFPSYVCPEPVLANDDRLNSLRKRHAPKTSRFSHLIFFLSHRVHVLYRKTPKGIHDGKADPKVLAEAYPRVYGAALQGKDWL